MFPSYRNQSIDLLRKSIDWFLYMRTLNVKWLNQAQKWAVIYGDYGTEIEVCRERKVTF